MSDFKGRMFLKKMPWPYNVITFITREEENVALSVKSFLKMIHEVLTDEELEVLEARCKDGKSLEETGKQFGLLIGKCREIELKTFRTLKKNLHRYSVVSWDDWNEEHMARQKAEQELSSLRESMPKAVGSMSPEEGNASVIEKMSIGEIGVTARIYSCLYRAGFHRLSDLLSVKSEDELKRVKNLGPKSVEELRIRLHALGYQFDWEE